MVGGLEYPGATVDIELALRVERICRFQFVGKADADTIARLAEKVKADSAALFDVLEVLVNSRPTNSQKRRDAAELTEQLREAGSVWHFTEAGQFLLTRRVDPTVSAAFETAIEKGRRSALHLRKAWASAYGRNPDPTACFRESVRAVEAAGCSVVEPRNLKATLGTMIGELKNNPNGYELTLHPAEKPRDGSLVDRFRAMCELLWNSQIDRHGTSNEAVPVAVSVEQAEAALHIAVTLVHWFERGFIKRK